MADNDWRDYQGREEEEEEEDIAREDLRDLLAFFGYDLPVTLGDIETVALEIVKAQRDYEFLLESQREIGESPRLLEVGRRKLGELGQKFRTYAEEKFGGTQALQTSRAFTIFSELLRPARPSIEEKPTPEEFLKDFGNAFSLHIEGMRSAGEISGAEADFAYNTLRRQVFEGYTAKLGEFAQAGVSPFALKEVTRGERGVAPGTVAGKALEAAVGPGVAEPTRIREEIGAEAAPEAAVGAGAAEQVERRTVELREAVEDIGAGVPREFVTMPRVMPQEFIEEILSAESIRLRYAGSLEGGGRGARPAPPGFKSSPRRV